MKALKLKIYEHVEYSQSIKVEIKHTPLPWDRRLKPWPAMKRLGIVALSWEEYRINLVRFFKSESYKRTYMVVRNLSGIKKSLQVK